MKNGQTHLYEQARDLLRDEIESGKYSEEAKLPSSKVLANELGVSMITIERALRELADQGFVQRVPRKGSFVLKKENWKSGSAHRRKSFLLGAVVYDAGSHPLWTRSLRGMEDVSNRRGYSLIIGNDDGSFDKARDYIDRFAERNMDGLIFVPIGTRTSAEYRSKNAALVECIENHGIPFIQFHRTVPGLRQTAVISDEYWDTRRLVQSAFDSGIRNPVCVSHYYTSTAEKFECAFLEVARARGVQGAEQRIVRLLPNGQKVRTEHREQLSAALAEAGEFDAVFTIGTDVLAVVSSELEQSAFASRPQPRLYTIDYSGTAHESWLLSGSIVAPTYELGAVAAGALIDHIERRIETPRTILLNSDLLLHDTRDSSVNRDPSKTQAEV